MIKIKAILFITVIWLAVLVSGCLVDKHMIEAARTTPTITVTATATPLMTPLPEVISTGILVKLDGVIGFIPNIQTIKAGDEVVWENFDPVTVILVSNDGFFDDKLLAFYQHYRYVFSTPGNYTFIIKNTNLIGTIIVESLDIAESPVITVSPAITESPVITESPANQTPAPSVTKSSELPFNALYVTARMRKLSNWSTETEIKYGLDALKVNVMSQINIPLTIKAQILSGDQILEEKTFTLEKQDSTVEFSNDQNHFINDTNVNLRLLIQGYQPIEYKFIEVDQLN
jgi:plastocyanin